MIAHLQRAILALWLLAVAAAIWALTVSPWHPVALLALALLLLGHAVVLAVEFVWMRAAHGRDPSPRPGALDLLGAWLAECVHAPWVFFWRQPLRHRRWPDHLPASPLAGRGVVLVHGYVCNRGLWNAWMARLTAQGVPYVAVDLEPPFGDIDDYRRIVQQAVDAVAQHTGRPPLVVAHSMGGLAVRAWWAGAPPEAIHHLVTLGSPHHGTRLARLGMTTNARQMREGGPWLQQLASREGAARRARTTCLYSHCDNIVFPPSNATLAGARSIHLRAAPHVAMVDHPAAWQLVTSLLDG